MDKYLISEPGDTPRVFRIRSVEQFIELATWLYGTDEVIFRGQERAWPLLPSVARDPEYIQCEREIVEEFKRESLPYLRDTPLTPWQWLAVAQHSGLPARLLDWTTNPLVALWFAVRTPPHENESGIVWACPYTPAEGASDTEHEESPFAIHRPRIYLPEHVFPNIQAQSDIFTVHHRDEEGRFLPFEETKDVAYVLTRIEASADDFFAIRYRLFRIGIHPSSMFPGLAGLVDRIRYQHELLADEKTVASGSPGPLDD